MATKKVVGRKSGAGSKSTTKVAKRTRTRSACLQTAIDRAPAPDVEVTTWLAVDFDRIPKKAWDTFLADLAETGNVTRTCKRIGLKRITVYSRAKRDPEFKAEMEEAHALGLRQLEDVAVKRATQGWTEPVFFQGEEVGGVQKYSDALLMFLLQGRDSRYKRKQEITGADGGPIHMLMQLSDDDLEAEIAARQRELENTPDA